jgi:EmrB/QacA subfamily drug resistance transporter
MEETKGISSKWLVLLTVSIGSFMSGLSSSMLNISFPRLIKVFETEYSVVLWVTVVFLLVSTGLMPILGRIGDIFGRKRVYILGFILFIVGLMLCSLSQSILQLILFRIVQAVGGAIIMALGYAIVTATFPDKERGKALGILTALALAGPLLGPVLSGFLLDILDWRSLFYLIIPVGIVGLVMAWMFLREQRVPNISSKLDLWGAGTFFGTLVCFLLFLNLGGRLGFSSPPVLILATSTVVLMILFFIQEKRTTQPMVDLNLFKNWPFTGGNVTLGIQSIALSGFIFLMPFYLIDGLGYSALETGFVYAIAPLVTVVIVPFTGWLSDKIGSRILSTIGMVLMSLGLFLFSGFNAESRLADIIPSLAVFGIGMGLFSSPNTSRIMGAVPKDRLGTASALMNTVGQIGMSSGMATFGVIFTSRQAIYAAQLAPDNLDLPLLHKLSLIGGYQDATLVAAIVCGIGIFTSLIRAKKQPN